MNIDPQATGAKAANALIPSNAMKSAPAGLCWSSRFTPHLPGSCSCGNLHALAVSPCVLMSAGCHTAKSMRSALDLIG